MTLLPCILDKTDLFLSRLEQSAISGETVSMGDYCTALTFDIIGERNHPTSDELLGSIYA
jgi:hypothetical protein